MRSSSRRQKADIARRELIGLEVSCGELKGRVVDETKHTFLVETPKGEKRVPKSGNRFVFQENGAAFEVDGADITFRPEDRTKKVRG